MTSNDARNCVKHMLRGLIFLVAILISITQDDCKVLKSGTLVLCNGLLLCLSRIFIRSYFKPVFLNFTSSIFRRLTFFFSSCLALFLLISFCLVSSNIWCEESLVLILLILVFGTLLVPLILILSLVPLSEYHLEIRLKLLQTIL